MQIIVLEDTKEYISYVSKEEAKTQHRRPADLLVCLDVEMRSTSYCIPVITKQICTCLMFNILLL